MIEILSPAYCQSYHSKHVLLAAAAMTYLVAVPGSGIAQTDSTSDAAKEIRIAMDIANGEVRCTPSKVRLSPRDTVGMQIENRADKPLWFVAPEFFRYANVPPSREPAPDPLKGGFLVAPKSTIAVRFDSFNPGEYYYSCNESGQPPTPLSSGVLVISPAG